MTCKIFVVLHEVSRSSVHHLSLGLGGFSSSSRFLNNFLCLLQNTSSSYLSSSTLISIRLLSYTKILGQLCILLRWDMHFYFYCFLSLCCLIQNTSKSWLLDSYFPLFFVIHEDSTSSIHSSPLSFVYFYFHSQFLNNFFCLLKNTS